MLRWSQTLVLVHAQGQVASVDNNDCITNNILIVMDIIFIGLYYWAKELGEGDEDSGHSGPVGQRFVLLDFLHPQRNPAFAVNQFVSQILSGNHVLARMWCRMLAVKDSAEMTERYPDASQTVRKGLVAGSVAHLQSY